MTQEILLNEASPAKERDSFFDNAKFLLILLVVIFNAAPFVSTGGAVYRLVYLFHMPAFVFVSGYFTKFQHIIKIDKFVFIYVILQSLLMIITEAEEFFTPIHAAWFLPALIIWKVFTPHIVRHRARFVLPIAVCAALIAGYDESIGAFFTLSRTICFFPFFLAGYYFKKDWLMRLRLTRFHLAQIGSVLLFIASGLIIGLAFMFRRGWTYYKQPYITYADIEWYTFLIRLGIMLWGALLVLCFFMLVPARHLPLISDMGKRTLQVFVTHTVILNLLDRIPIREHIQEIWELSLFFVACGAAAIVLMIPRFHFGRKGDSRP